MKNREKITMYAFVLATLLILAIIISAVYAVGGWSVTKVTMLTIVGICVVLILFICLRAIFKRN